MLTRVIPSSGEKLPVVGVGTWENFDVSSKATEQAPLGDVLSSLFAAGGSVIDSSPMYARAEAVVGTLLSGMQPRPKAFIATKVWTQGAREGIEQMQRSMQLMHAQPMDLMQVHNLLDWRVHLPTLLAWKDEGRLRYTGITHYTPSGHAELESVIRAAPWDFVQLDYALDDRAAEQRLLPLAQERGIAVLVNRPFGGGGLLKRLGSKPLPEWAAELGCTNWAALLLKFILGHPAVTCAIPGTGNPEHMKQILEAGEGPLPDETMKKKMHALVS